MGSGKVFNPDISANGNFIAAAGRNPFATLSPMQLSEVESRSSPSSILTPVPTSSSPQIRKGSKSRRGNHVHGAPRAHADEVGKLRAQFGKMNTLHTHSLPSVDRSLVTDNLVGGEEGWSDAGISVSHFAESVHVLGADRRGVCRDVGALQERAAIEACLSGRARGYRDINESSNIDVGASFATGPTNVVVTPTCSPVPSPRRRFLLWVSPGT